MAERLTEYYYTDNNKPVYTIRYSNIHNYIEIGDDGVEDLIVQKLGKTEDIMEKYGIESVEEFDKNIEYVNKIIKAYKTGSWKKEKQELKTDRDTWKRACELACDVLRDINYKIYNEDRIDFENTFYQQAKKEGNDEQI